MSGSSGMPWFKFFPSDWLGGTVGLTAAEIGIYITLIAMMYDRQEPVPVEPERLARRCGTNVKGFNVALKVLVEEGKIVTTEAGLWNARVEIETQSRISASGKAKRAANFRWNNNSEQNQQEDDATALQTHDPSICLDDAPAMLCQKPDARSQKEDKNPLTIESNSLAAQQRARGASPDAAPRQEGNSDLEGRLRRAAGWAHDDPRLADTTPIQKFLDQGVDLETVILPVIRAKAPYCGNPNWKYFAGPISDAIAAVPPAANPATVNGTGHPAPVIEQYRALEGSPQFEAWKAYRKTLGKRTVAFDLQLIEGNRSTQRGLYVDAEWPPGHPEAGGKP